MTAATQKSCGSCGFADHHRAASEVDGRVPESFSLYGERKQVTVLFADIEGSLQLFAQMDPEDTQHLLDPVLKCMVEAVQSFGGLVTRVMGDGIMAAFGVPIAREQHAFLACCAAMRMQREVGKLSLDVSSQLSNNVRIRVGINSGEVVVRTFADRLHLDYAAVGVASRIEQIAAPGSIALTAQTVELTRGHAKTRSLGHIEIKGLSAPIEVFELLGVNSNASTNENRNLAPFTGREFEVRALQEAWERTLLGKPQGVVVVGEPGVGKSRIVEEFLRTLGGGDAFPLVSRASVSSQTIAYSPVVDLLREYFGIEQQHSVEEVANRVAQRVLKLELSDRTEGPLLHLLDALPSDHPFRATEALQRRRQIYDALESLLRAHGRFQPLILVFEDLQWHDSLTLGLIEALSERLRAERVLFISTRRDDATPSSLPNCRELKMLPLAGPEFSSLARALIGTDASLERLQNFLLERAGGNPFYLEELVRTLIETGVIRGAKGNCRLAKNHSPDHVPPTIQAVIAERIDRLPSDEKSIIQACAVIGKTVPLLLLEAIQDWPEVRLHAALDNLQSRHFLYLGRPAPDAQYQFQHALTHEVSYSGLLRHRRRDVHARIAAAIEVLYSDRLSEQVERLAEHALRGGLADKAVIYLRQAGLRASEREAYSESVALFERALTVLDELPRTPEHLRDAVDLRLDLRNALQPLGDRVRIAGYLREAQPIAEQLGDARRVGWIQAHLTEQCWMLGLANEALVAGEQALNVAHEVADMPLQVVTNLSLGLLHHTRGNYAKAMDYFGWNFDRLKGPLAQQRFGMFVQPASFSGSFLAWSLAEKGEFDRARMIVREAALIADEGKHAFSRSYVQLGIGVVALRQGRVHEAIDALRLALADPAFSDSPVGFAFVALHLGYGLSLAGDTSAGIALLEKTVQIAEAWNFVARHSLRLAYLAEAFMLAARFPDAENTARRALALSIENSERANQAYALRVVGEVSLRLGRLVDAESQLSQALQLSNELGMLPLAAHCHRGLWAAMATGPQHRHQANAISHATTSRSLVATMNMRYWDEPGQGA